MINKKLTKTDRAKEGGFSNSIERLEHRAENLKQTFAARML
jgi:hypothetical protein